MMLKTKMKNTSSRNGKFKLNKKIHIDPTADNECKACLHIKNAICNPFITLEKNIPHTCCNINDEASRKKMELEFEIASLLKLAERDMLERRKVE